MCQYSNGNQVTATEIKVFKMNNPQLSQLVLNDALTLVGLTVGLLRYFPFTFWVRRPASRMHVVIEKLDEWDVLAL